MKAITPLQIAISSLALVAYAQADKFGGDYREHNVTVALKLSMEDDEKFEETKNGFKASQKIVTSKVSNKQILEALVEEGVIDDIKGWSIKALTAGSGGIVGIFLTNKNESPIDVSDYFEYDIYFALEKYKEQLKEDDKGNEKYKEVYHIFGTGFLDVFIGDFSTDTCSIVKVAGEEKSKEDGEDFESLAVIKKASFEKTVGEAYFEDEPFGVIEGSIKAGNGKDTDLGDDD